VYDRDTEITKLNYSNWFGLGEHSPSVLPSDLGNRTQRLWSNVTRI